MRRISLLTKQLQPSRRLLHQSSRHSAATFAPSPSPPKLPEEDQRVYEELQKGSTGAFSTPRPRMAVNQSPASRSSDQEPRSSPPPNNYAPSRNSSNSQSTQQEAQGGFPAKVTAEGEGEELHPDVRRGAKPEFEGDRNPQTGEVDGPKNNPLRWGGEVDWSYNGRVTDF